jgi:two-component system chemotaxis response regulator CheB
VREVLESSEEGLQVIALVGSAAGLTAVSEVLGGLPADLNAAVIVLIHQAPERENKLVQILGRASRLPVEAARNHVPLRAGTVVVAPPGKHVLIGAGPVIRLIASGASPPSRPSADLLLTTLATACGPRATAVVLSGGGHDGATGATAVHHFGGTVLASDELTSEYFAMPQATIERDSVIDRVLPLGEIAALLVSRAPHSGESQKPALEPDELVRVARERERVEAKFERDQQAERRELAPPAGRPLRPSGERHQPPGGSISPTSVTGSRTSASGGPTPGSAPLMSGSGSRTNAKGPRSSANWSGGSVLRPRVSESGRRREESKRKSTGRSRRPAASWRGMQETRKPRRTAPGQTASKKGTSRAPPHPRMSIFGPIHESYAGSWMRTSFRAATRTSHD